MSRYFVVRAYYQNKEQWHRVFAQEASAWTFYRAKLSAMRFGLVGWTIGAPEVVIEEYAYATL